MLKEKELLLLAHFRKDARANLTKISKDTGVPVSTIFDKLNGYKNGIITRFTTLLDFQKLGYDIRVNFILKVEKSRKEELMNFLLKHGSVNSVFRINNDFDFLAEGIFRNMQELNEFTEELNKYNVLQKHEHFILQDLKREAFMADTELVHLA